MTILGYPIHRATIVALLKSEVFLYLLFGGFSSLISVVSYTGLFMLGLPNLMAVCLSWILAVSFAFFTNRGYVFKSETHILRDGIYFLAARLITLGLQLGLMWILVDHLNTTTAEGIPRFSPKGPLWWYAPLVNLFVTALVIVLNYVFSKMFIFRKHEHGEPKKNLKDC